MSDRDRDLRRAWERGKPAELERGRPRTSVLSIRVPTELLRELSDRAGAQGKSTSELARELIESALLADGPSTPRELAAAFARWVEEVLPDSGRPPQ
jgi:plasmid stability protein